MLILAVIGIPLLSLGHKANASSYTPIYKQSVSTVGTHSNPNGVRNYPSVGVVPTYRNIAVNTSNNTIASELITNGIQNRLTLLMPDVSISQGARYVLEFELTHFGGNNSNTSLNDFSVEVYTSDNAVIPQNIPLKIRDYGLRNIQSFDFVAGSNMNSLDFEFVTNYQPISSGWRQVSFYGDFKLWLYDDFVAVNPKLTPEQSKAKEQEEQAEQNLDDADDAMQLQESALNEIKDSMNSDGGNLISSIIGGFFSTFFPPMIVIFSGLAVIMLIKKGMG